MSKDLQKGTPEKIGRDIISVSITITLPVKILRELNSFGNLNVRDGICAAQGWCDVAGCMYAHDRKELRRRKSTEAEIASRAAPQKAAIGEMKADCKVLWVRNSGTPQQVLYSCLLYTSDAADDTPCVDL
eukprot:6487715-Amphidinium_carterae.1